MDDDTSIRAALVANIACLVATTTPGHGVWTFIIDEFAINARVKWVCDDGSYHRDNQTRKIVAVVSGKMCRIRATWFVLFVLMKFSIGKHSGYPVDCLRSRFSRCLDSAACILCPGWTPR